MGTGCARPSRDASPLQARQHLNHVLARRRAEQVQRVQLAIIFAKLGYTDAALQQARIVPVASARIACEIQCRLTSGELLVERGLLHEAAATLDEVARAASAGGIRCGMLVDPWNILGFQGQFSLFPSPESSVHDHRIEQLIELLEQTFALYAMLWSESAARRDESLGRRLSEELMDLGRAAGEYASTTVEIFQASPAPKPTIFWGRSGRSNVDLAFWRCCDGHIGASGEARAVLSLSNTELLESKQM